MRRVNRRTLAGRITKTTWLCILLGISVFTATMSFLSIRLTKQNGSFFAGIFANTLADKISSPEYLDYLSITDIRQLRPNSTEAALIYTSMKYFEANTYSYYLVDDGQGLLITVPTGRRLVDFLGRDAFSGKPFKKLGDVAFGKLAQVRIVINGDQIYASDYWDKLTPELARLFGSNELTPLAKSLVNFFGTQATYYIPGSSGNPVAEVQVRLSSTLSINFYMTLLLGILSAALASYAASLIITTLFTRNVAKPFIILDRNLNNLAEGNYDELLNSHIQVKKPLWEIQSIAESTNIILDKMHEFNEIIGSQNELLDKQNTELESQNEELSESRRQIRDAQTQLVQNQNMASVGQLTAAISHEINTPLGTITSNVQLQNMILDMLMSKQELTRDEEVGGILAQMRASGENSAESCARVSLIIKSLKNFSRLDQADFQETDINENAKSVVLLTRYLWKNKINLHEDYGALPYVKCYPGLLNQVFMNVLVNAIHALPEGGDIHIKTWANSEYVYASVRDNGKGMDCDKLTDIFDGNYSLNDGNSGLGLTICKNIMNKHNGFIEGWSEIGRGTEIVLKLPVIC